MTAGFYAVGLLIVMWLYDEPPIHARPGAPSERGRVTFKKRARVRELHLLMVVIFAVQFVDRSFGPILPLYIEQLGVSHERVPLAAGILFSVAAFAGAGGHHICGRLLAHHSPRVVISGGAAAAGAGSVLMVLAPTVWLMGMATAIFGLGVGLAMTAAYCRGGVGHSSRRARIRLWRPDERLARRACGQPGRLRLPRRCRDDAAGVRRGCGHDGRSGIRGAAHDGRRERRRRPDLQVGRDVGRARRANAAEPEVRPDLQVGRNTQYAHAHHRQ